jgi:DNA-directed RNA polymerase, beta subunit/140 kD subunit
MNLVKEFLYFNPPEKIQLESYNYFVSHSVKKILEHETIETDQLTLRIENVEVEKASREAGLSKKPFDFSPEECVNSATTYNAKIKAVISYFFKCNNKKSYVEICIGRLPVMVGSNLCVHETVKDIMKCYFVVKGSKKVICMEERIAYNYPFLLSKKKEFKFYKYVELKSLNSILRSSLIDVGARILKNNKYVILVYCPELMLRELLPIEWFLILFLKYEDIKNGLTCITKSAPIEYQSEICSIIVNNFFFNVNKESIYQAIYSANIKMKTVKDISILLKEHYLIHMSDLSVKDKGIFTMYLLKILLYGLVNYIAIDDRDHYGNKRIYTVNHFFTTELFHIFHKKYKKKITTIFNKSPLQHQVTNDETIRIMIEKNEEITNSFSNCLSSNAWHGKPQSSQYVSQLFDPFNGLHYLDLIRKINTPVKNESNKILGPRDLHLTQADILCPYGTPDGKKVGLVKYPSVQSILTIDTSQHMSEICRELLREYLRDMSLSMTIVLVNGNCIGTIETIAKDAVLKTLLRLKTELQFYQTSTYYSKKLNAIIILSDAGRLLYPVVVSGVYKNYNLMQCLNKGLILFLDKHELEEFTMVEKDIFTIGNEQFFDMVFSFSLGYIGSLIPYSNHNQAPRNIYQCQMSKQALGFLKPIDQPSSTYNYLLYPQIPLISTITQMGEFFYEHPTGINAIVSIMPFLGENQEDSLILNKSSIDRGLFASGRDIIFRHILENKDILCSPSSEPEYTIYNFDKLDKRTGIIKVNEFIKKNDVLISVKRPKKNDSLSKKPEDKVEPALIFQIEDCIMHVMKTNVLLTDKGENIITIVTTELLFPQIGDKFSSRHGQKGTVGMIVPSEDLPFTEDGITPDILINPLCIPSRMTIGHMLEMSSGVAITRNSKIRICKICAKYKRNLVYPRCEKDCFLDQTISYYLHHTPFYCKLIPEHIKEFKACQMYCGLTGKKLEVIYTGVIYYQRLKHMSRDKVYVRTTGPIQPVTRQPKEGRSVEGGHRFGLQERDCILSHGCAFTLRDRLFLNSDYYKLYICECGMIYHGKDPSTYKFASCSLCHSFNLFLVELPCASKVLIQLLLAFNINMRLLPSLR